MQFISSFLHLLTYTRYKQLVPAAVLMTRAALVCTHNQRDRLHVSNFAVLIEQVASGSSQSMFLAWLQCARVGSSIACVGWWDNSPNITSTGMQHPSSPCCPADGC